MDHKTLLKLLFWVSTAIFVLESGVCREQVLQVPTTSASPVSQAVDRRGYSRFHANDSYVGQPVPCTHDEKVCLSHNLIFDPRTDQCQPLGGGGHGCYLRANRQEFEHGSGHIVGACQKHDDPCTHGLRSRMAYDGHCYDHQAVFNDLCERKSYLSFHFLGGVECRNNSIPPILVEQPEDVGRCLLPDFRTRHPPASFYYDHPLTTVERPVITLDCGHAAQRRCFEQGKVWVEGASGCHALLKQGPCPADHVVAIDGRAAVAKRAEATCVHVRGGCPQGHMRMAFDGECHADRDIALSVPGAVQLNAYGIHEVLNYAKSVSYTPLVNEDKCEVDFLQFWPGIG